MLLASDRRSRCRSCLVQSGLALLGWGASPWQAAAVVSSRNLEAHRWGFFEPAPKRRQHNSQKNNNNVIRFRAQYLRLRHGLLSGEVAVATALF